MTVFKDRIIRAAKLDVNLYEEVEADRGVSGFVPSELRKYAER